jgi:Tfp pilus assembly protein PilZ
MSEEQANTEQRQFPRINVATVVSFAVVMPAYETGSTEDISQGGLCLKVNRVLPLGTVLRLEFDLPGDKPEHIEVLGKVVWQRPDNAAIFSTGIKFLS